VSADITTIAPHGGTLVNRLVESDHGQAALRGAQRWQSLRLDPRTLADVELIATGGYSPLTGFMGRDDYLRVLHEMRLSTGAPWPLPITLRVTDATALRDTVVLEAPDGSTVGLLDVREVFTHSKQEEAQLAYGTTA